MADIPSPLLPVGYRFVPRDHELLNNYLKPRINHTLVPSLYPKIIEFDIYAEHPSKLFACFEAEGEEEDEEEDVKHYLFTPLKKTSEKGSRINRRVGNYGTWKAENSKEILMPKTKMMIGYKKYFKYVPDDRERGKEAEVEFLMHEFSLRDNQEIVMCQITRKINKKRGLHCGGGAIEVTQPIVAVEVQEPKAKRACVRQMISHAEDHGVQQQQSLLFMDGGSLTDHRFVENGALEPHGTCQQTDINNLMQPITTVQDPEAKHACIEGSGSLFDDNISLEQAKNSGDGTGPNTFSPSTSNNEDLFLNPTTGLLDDIGFDETEPIIDNSFNPLIMSSMQPITTVQVEESKVNHACIRDSSTSEMAWQVPEHGLQLEPSSSSNQQQMICGTTALTVFDTLFDNFSDPITPKTSYLLEQFEAFLNCEDDLEDET